LNKNLALIRIQSFITYLNPYLQISLDPAGAQSTTMTTRENTAISAAEQVYGMPITIPGKISCPIVDNFLQPASTDINTFYPTLC
jgi:hypothetical protein